MRKTVFIIILVAVLAVGACLLWGGRAKAAYYTSGDWKYEVNGTKATITGYTGTASSITIPEMLDGYTVTEIGSSAFKNNTRLEHVTMPSTLVKIGYEAFKNCEKLHNLYLNEGLEEIGSYAFSDCDIIKLTLPKTLTELNYYAFENNRNMTDITVYSEMLNSLYTVFDRAGRNTETGVSVVFKSSVKNINCFFRPSNSGNYPAVTKVTIERGVKSISYNAFEDCIDLKTVAVYEDNLEIDDPYSWYEAFGDPKNVTVVCHYGSTAYEYAKKMGYKIALLWKTGDLNADQKIDTSDAVVVLKSAAGMISLSSDQKIIGDVNRDGSVTTLDAVMILRYSAGMINKF